MSFSFGGTDALASPTAKPPSGAKSTMSSRPRNATAGFGAAAAAASASSGATAAAATAASASAVSFTSLAQSFSQLLDVLNHPNEHNLTPKEMGDLLAYLSPRLLSTTGSFRPPSSASTAELQSGRVRSSFVNAAGEYDTQQLHDEWKKIITEFSEAMQLDAMQAYHLLETYLHLYHYNGASQSAGASGGGSRDSSTVTLPELIQHYYVERSSLLQCLAALFRIYLDDAHLYHSEVTEVLRKLSQQGLEEQLLARFKETADTKMPQATAAAATAAASPTTAAAADAKPAAPSNLLLEDAELASKFADQMVNEQALLLELVFLLYYDADEFLGAEPALPAAGVEAGTTAAASAGQARILRLYSLLHSVQFGRVQPLYTFLSSRGRSSVEWLGQLSVLLCVEVMSFEKLMRVYNYPLQDMKELIAATRAQAAKGGAIDDESYERNRAAAVTLLEGAELTFREHPFSDLDFLARLDSTFFEREWNPKTMPGLPSLCGPINLAWAVAISHVYEFLEDLAFIKQEFDLLGVDSETQRPIYAVNEFATEKQIIVQRLEASLCASTNPFHLLASVLASIQQRSIAGADHVAANLPAFKEIVHELLSALFESTCYSALSSLGPVTLAPLFPLFNLIFYEDAALCYRFWQNDEKNPQDRSPLFDSAIALFPLDPCPLLHLLTALAGKTVARPLRFDAQGDAFDTSALTLDVDADSLVCANRVFDTLCNMKQYTSVEPPTHLLHKLDEAQEFNVLLASQWLSPDNVLLPANTFGRVVAGNGADGSTRWVQWFHSYSAWPLLLQRLEGACKRIRSSLHLSAKEWIEMSTILQLMAKITLADPNIYAQLTAHLQEAGRSSGVNDTTALSLYTINASFASVGQHSPRDLNLLVLLMRIQSFVSLHAPGILGAVAAASKQSAADASALANQSSHMDATFDPLPSSNTNTTLLLATPAGVQLQSSHLLSLLESCASLLYAGARHDLQRWLRAFNFVAGKEMSSATSAIYADVANANLLSNVSLLNAHSPAQATYNSILVLQRSLSSLQGPLGRHAVHIIFLDQLSTLLLPLYQMSSIQNLRLHTRSDQHAFVPWSASRSGAPPASPSSLPINTSLSAFLTTFDMHTLLKYLCECVFVQYDEWHYAVRAQRWTLGSHILRLFLIVLSNPSAPPTLPNAANGHGAAAPSPLHSISLQQYLYTLFLTEPSMLLALLRPLLLGLSLLDRLNYDRQQEAEISALEDLLSHTFLVLGRLMNMEGQRAAVATVAGTNKPASFFSVLLETVSAAHAPASWRYTSRRRGGRFHATPNSLLHAMSEYVSYTRSAELQSLAVQTIRLLCASGQAGAPATNLTQHFQAPALLQFRTTCLQLLTAHSTELSLKVQLLQLLATMFERQPAMAERFASTRSDVTDAAGESDEEEEDDSLFQLLKAYLLTAEENFSRDSQSLHLIFRIIGAVWQSAASRAIGMSHLHELQQRLRKEVPQFWEHLTHCLTAEIQEAPSASADANGAVWDSVPFESSTLSYFLSIKLVRTCVWSIINLELFQSLFGSGGALDPALADVLSGYAQSSSTPHRYLHFLTTYCHSSENVARHRQVVEQLHHYGLDLSLFASLPSVSDAEEGVTSRVYNLDLLTKIAQLDLDVAFERETVDAEERSMSMHLSGRHDGEESTALVLRDSNVNATSHRQRIEQLLLSVKKVNNSLLIADAELMLLKAWRSFVHICLQKQPALLGVKPKSALAYEFVQQTAEILVQEQRMGEGEVMGEFLQHVSSLLLAFLSAGLVESSASSGPAATAAAGPAPLSSAILIHLSRSHTRNNTQPSIDIDDKVAGTGVFSVANQLLANVAETMRVALAAYAPQRSAAAAEEIVPAFSNISATAVPATARARTLNFDATARIGAGWIGRRIASAIPSGSLSVGGTPLVSNPAALSFVQNLSASTLLLIRWSNHLLMSHFAHPSQSTEQIVSPVLAPTGAGGRLGSPTPARRLDLSPQAPRVGTTLAPVIERQSSIAGGLVHAIGEQYASTCHSLLSATAACIAQPHLSDAAITTLPLLLQAIDIVQGASMARNENALKDFIRHDADPIDAALELLRPVLPSLLHNFASIPTSQPLIAQKLVQLFCVIAQYEKGAEMLVQHSLMLYICRHHIFNPQTAAAAPASAAGLDTDSHYQPSFSPYTPSHTRDPWHLVWLLCLHLISTLLRSVATKSRLSSLGGDGASPLSSPVQTKLLEEVLAFLNLFSGPRLNKVLHLSHLSHHSVGSLEEVDALTRLLYEFERYGRLWHSANPALHQTHKTQVLLVVTYYMRQLNDPRELEKRILVVTPDEKADAADAAGGEGAGGASEDALPNPDFAHALTRNATTAPDETGVRGAPLERQKSEALLADEKKRTWRALGSSTGLNSGASTPHQLSTPTTPRSTSTPLTQTPGGGPSDDKILESLRNANALSVNVMLTPPARAASSFLLRSPVVGSLVNRGLEADHSDPAIGTGYISGANAADVDHAASNAQPQGKAHFEQRIEFAMCLILRNCLSYLRLVSESYALAPVSMSDVLFTHRIKVVSITSPSLLHPGGGGSGSGGLSSQSASSGLGGGMWTRMLHTGAPNAAHVGLTSRQQIVQLFSGLGLGLDEEAQMSAADMEIEHDYEDDDGPRGAQPTFRPPLSMLVDFEQYAVRVLSRLHEIQRSSGLLDSLDDEEQPRTLATLRSLLPSSAHLLSSGSSSSSSSLSSCTPSIAAIHRVMSFLLENSLLLTVQHVQLHVARLKRLQQHYLAQIMPGAQQHMQMQMQQHYYAQQGYGQQEPLAPSPPAVHPAAIRVGKLLETYRERINHLCDLLSHYMQLLASGDRDPAPPSLHAAHAHAHAHPLRSSRLVAHLLDTLEGIAAGLAKHAVAFHRFLHGTHQQHMAQ